MKELAIFTGIINKNSRLWLLCMMVGLCTCMNAQNEKGISRLAKKVATFIDSLSVRGLDRRYIDAPEKPWQIILQGNFNQSDLKMKTVIDGKAMFDETWGDINWEPRIKTPVKSYVGVWAGYRGYGIGYSRDVSGKKGSIFSVGVTGSYYGANLRIHQFTSSEPMVHLSGYMPNWEEDTESYELIDPIKVRSMTLDAFYFFNRKRFSNAAAYDQSVIQKRSSGSFMVGAKYYHSTVRYDEGKNADFIMFMNDIGRMKQYQVSIGGGYAYNLVPCKGLLVSAQVMPMLICYNRLDIWRYSSLLREKMYEEKSNPSTEEIADLEQLFQLQYTGREHMHTKPSLMFNARLSLTYNIDRWFFNANGHWQRFSYRLHEGHGNLTDWYVNASVGIRL